jgi:hypothetical protein
MALTSITFVTKVSVLNWAHGSETGQTHRKVGTQNLRPKGQVKPYGSGIARKVVRHGAISDE